MAKRQTDKPDLALTETLTRALDFDEALDAEILRRRAARVRNPPAEDDKPTK